MPDVSVIIPVYNDAERLAKCLDALSRQTMPADRFEVIVVDNGSDEPPREVVEAYPFCRYTEEKKVGSYAARNHALQIAQGEILAFTDADCLPEPTWLERITQAVREAGPDHGAVGGYVDIFPAREGRPTTVELYDGVYGMPQEQCVNIVHFAVTANMATCRAVIDRVGPFDDTLKSGGDVEWGQRLESHGLPVSYEAEAVVKHPARNRWSDILKQGRRHAGGRFDMKPDHRASRYFSWHYLGVARKLLLPDLQDLRQISSHPSITTAWQKWRVVGVLMSVRYAQIYEHFRLLFRGKSIRE